MQSKWADINGAWDAVHQFTLYAREQGADYTDGWCWCYDHGKGAGDHNGALPQRGRFGSSI